MTQLVMGSSLLDVQRQIGHTTLARTNHYASLNADQLRKSHEKYSPFRNDGETNYETFGTGYWTSRMYRNRFLLV